MGTTQVILGRCRKRHDLDVSVAVELRLRGKPGLHSLGAGAISLEPQQLAGGSVVHEEEVTHVSIVAVVLMESPRSHGEIVELLEQCGEPSQITRDLPSKRWKYARART